MLRSRHHLFIWAAVLCIALAALLGNEARVFTYKDATIVTPNSDTPYSLAGLDLRAEPMVLCVPAVEKRRCYDVQLVGM